MPLKKYLTKHFVHELVDRSRNGGCSSSGARWMDLQSNRNIFCCCLHYINKNKKGKTLFQILILASDLICFGRHRKSLCRPGGNRWAWPGLFRVGSR